MSPPAVGRERAAITQCTWGPPREISTSPAPCTFTTRKKRTLGNRRINRVGTTRMTLTNSTADVEQWGIFEQALRGSAEGNPYLDVEFTAQFAYRHRVIEVDGFYDADGMPYNQVGTTCYAWTHQSDDLEGQTLVTLRDAPFNKLRMCVFPKHYLFNENEPEFYPFPCLSRGSSTWDIG